MPGTHDLLVLSNRGPLRFVPGEDGGVEVRRAAGGLVVIVGPGAQSHGALWLAAASSSEDREAAAAGLTEAHGFQMRPVVIEPADYQAYYDVVANQTLWFCLHGLWDAPRRPRFDRAWWAAWERFEAVNENFAESAAEAAAPHGTVLIQDFHLCLVPGMLSSRRPDLHVAAFMHTPWCPPAELAMLPDRVATGVLEGLGGGGTCGFHSRRWAREFERCCEERLGRVTPTFVAAGVPDVADLRSVASSAECDVHFARLDGAAGDRSVIVRVERIELSKNVLRGFWAFDELLETRSDLRGRVVFAAMLYPSRTGLSDYLAYAQEVQALAALLNSRWGTADWTPILVDPDDNYPRSVAALRRADVLLVNPIRDGFNLVAMEGPVVNERDAVLVLSQQAGAWDEIGEHALSVNPFDVSATAEALARALDMTPEERAVRAAALRKLAEERTPREWFDEQLSAARRG